MAYESIKVDIIPGAENAEVLHFSQFDNKRPFFIELFNGGAEFIPESGMSLTLECRKRDGNIVILSDPVVNDNVAEFSTTEQLTACYGDNTAEIKIVDNNDLVIGSANFIINVEKSPTCGGLVSESEIDNLTQQIAAIVPEVISEDYYNKAQTDALLANKANMSDLATLVSKAELTQAINDEDTALKNWASSNFATPGYVNERIFNILPVGSASGNPCIFNTEIAAALQALTAKIVCGGGGGGTPLAPIPLVPHSELNLDVNGQTFTVAFGQTVYGGVYDKSGRLTITHTVLTFNGSGNWSTRQSGVGTLYELNFTEPIKAETESISNMYVWEMNLTANNTFRILASGNIKVIAIHDDNRTDLATFKSFLSNNNLTICVELTTPIVIDVPSISVFAENGVNNIVSDGGGDVNVSYKDTIQHYIDSRI